MRLRAILALGLILTSCARPQKDESRERARVDLVRGAWSIAEAESGDSLRALVQKDTALARGYRERDWNLLLFSPPRLNAYGRLVLDICEARPLEALSPDPLVDSALLAYFRAESIRAGACQMVFRDSLDSGAARRELADLYRAYFGQLAQAEIFLVNAWRNWADAMDRDVSLEEFFKDPLAASLKAEPMFREYRILRASLAMYARMPDWDRLSFGLKRGEKIQKGDRGPRVREIQERLAAEGFYQGKISGVFDEETERAVKAFQHFHYLEEDGVVGPGTLRAMNTSRKKLISSIKRGLLYWRTTPLEKAVKEGGWVFRVNIPEFTLYIYKDGKLLQKNKVAVGAASSDTNYTPTLRDTVEFIVINPKWNVPDRIFEEELLEDIYDAGDAFEYIKKKKFQVASKKDKIWLVRDPGRGNALGRVKFLFPNRYNIYLHDTPLKSVFLKKYRAVSHGCIRLDGALELALSVLTENEGWSEKGFQKALDKKEKKEGKEMFKETWVRLRHKIPIFVDYVLTAADDAEPRVIFLHDIYKGYEGKRRVY